MALVHSIPTKYLTKLSNNYLFNFQHTVIPKKDQFIHRLKMQANQNDQRSPKLLVDSIRQDSIPHHMNFNIFNFVTRCSTNIGSIFHHFAYLSKNIAAGHVGHLL